MCTEIRKLEPSRRVFEVKLEDASSVRSRFRGYRIGLAPVLFTDDPKYRPLRRAALRLAPTKILAYNARLERHHLWLSQPIASWLFWRGAPLDRIFLRPRWLAPWRAEKTIRPEGHRVVEGRARREGRSRLAVLSPYFPFPLSHGGAVRIFHMLREAAREFDVTLYSFTEEEIAEADLEPVLQFVTRVYLIKKPRYREPRWSTLRPPEVCEYESPAMRRLWKAREADVAQVEYTQLAAYGGDILVEHDVTQDLYKQVLDRQVLARKLAGGASSSKAWRYARSAWWNWTRWKRFEDRAVRRFLRVVVMSDKDAALLGISRACVLENGVDLDRFEPSPETPGRKLLFIGSFRHFPNVVAFRFLTEQILPLIPDVELTVVAGADPWIHWTNITGSLRPPEDPRVRILEFVADVRPLYREANVIIVPTLESAGTNIKVLEALAMERAVVSTSSGCAGLGLEHSTTAWIADSAEGLAEGVRKLMNDAALRQSIALAGRRHAQQHFGWRSIGIRERAMLREIAGDPLWLRPATQNDLGRIAQIQGASPAASQWEPESYLRYDCIVAGLRTSQEVAGFMVTRTIEGGEHEILNLAVDPSARRRGVARRLLEEALHHEDQASKHSWFLEVRESNTSAIRLYEESGFRRMGVRKNYYSDPSEAGIVMRGLS